MVDQAAQRPCVEAENNPWYLLATLYGQPTPGNAELRARNRGAWNRCMARALTEESWALLAQKGHPAEELTPFSDEELDAIQGAFAERHRQATCTGYAVIPDPLESEAIDFSDVDFDNRFLVDGYIFPVSLHFEGATFSEWAVFQGAIFRSEVSFVNTEMKRETSFEAADFRAPRASSAPSCTTARFGAMSTGRTRAMTLTKLENSSMLTSA